MMAVVHRYLESLNEPTPYDHIHNIPNLHCNSDIVPDLLQFPRSQVTNGIYGYFAQNYIGCPKMVLF